MSTEETKVIARRLMDRLDQRDLDGVLALCAPDATWHGFAPQPLDSHGYKAAISTFLNGFPDSRFPVDDWISEADTVAVRHRFQGTHQADFQGIPPTGKQVNVPAIVIYRVDGGKVKETWLTADLLGLMQQLGVVPALASME